jgi:poly(3-hydroxybutyrate) depolymerase
MSLVLAIVNALRPRASPTPMSEHIVDGHAGRVWCNADGVTVIESYTIADMAHGTPLSSADVGVAGPYMLDAGISSSDHIAKFFGLTDAAPKRDISGLRDRLFGSDCLAPQGAR